MFNLIFNPNIKIKTKNRMFYYFEKYSSLFGKYFYGMRDVDIYFCYSAKNETEYNKDEKLFGTAYYLENCIEIDIYQDDFREKDFVQLFFHELNHVYRGFYERDI